MKLPPFILILLASLMVPAMSMAQDNLQIFELKHQNAETIIPLLRPLLDPDTRITGRNGTLIIRGSEQALSTAAEALQTLDSAPQQLLITVRQDRRENAHWQGFGIDPRKPRALIFDDQHQQQDNAAQHIRTLEGQWAQIRTGESVPVQNRSVFLTPHGAVVQQQQEYQEFATGFEVNATVAGDRVHLRVRPFSQRPTGDRHGHYDVQEITTSLEGRIGEWIDIGGQNDDNHRSESGIIYGRQGRSQSDHKVSLKVELIH